MKLSIIIIQYKETIEQMDLLLTMLDKQIGIDFNDIECVIVNDCGTPLKQDDVFKYKNLQPKLLQTETNGGAGLCRQYGIDHTSGEIYTFFDADDLPYSLGYLKEAIEGINKSLQKDKNKSLWICNMWEVGQHRECNQTESSQTWLHGKFFRRSYIEKLGLKFSPKYRVQEDSYFLALCMLGMEKYIDRLDINGYLWEFNKDSTTRLNSKDYVYGKHIVYMEQATDVAKILLHTDRDGVLEYILCIAYYSYFVAQCDDLFTSEYKEYKDRIDKAFYEYYHLFKKAITLASKQAKKYYYDLEKKASKSIGFKKEHETFKKYCDRVIEVYGNGTR